MGDYFIALFFELFPIDVNHKNLCLETLQATVWNFLGCHQAPHVKH